jgi:hypothetical protein
VEGRLHLARKFRFYDEWDPKVEPYDPYRPGAKVDDASNFLDDEPAGDIDVIRAICGAHSTTGSARRYLGGGASALAASRNCG